MENLLPTASELEFHRATLSDQDWFMSLYTDPEIMRWIPDGVMSQARAQETAARATSESLKNGLGYIIDKKFWGRGLATLSANAAIQFAINTLKIDRLLAFVGNENLASIQIVKKLKFKKLSESPDRYPGNSTWEFLS